MSQNPPRPRVVIVSPVRNEEMHLERTLRAMAAQTCPPDRWIVVDDGSDDGTHELLQAHRTELPFLEVRKTPPAFTSDRGDRLAVAAAPRAFNYGLAGVDVRHYDFIGKLDGDIELPADYFERLLDAFATDAALGIAGGWLVEEREGRWEPVGGTETHVRGALKLYSRECFLAIDGIQEILGWDGLDETTARMNGYRTRSLRPLVARHHRHTGSADGRLRGHVRWGASFYVLHYPMWWVLARAVRTMRSRPAGISGVAFLYGYLQAGVRRMPRAGDADYRRFARQELRRRALRLFRPAAA